MTSFYFSISHIIDSKVANNSIKSKFIFSDAGYSHTQVLKKSVYTKDIQKFQQNMIRLVKYCWYSRPDVHARRLDY